MKWLAENWNTILATAATIHAGAIAVVNATKTPEANSKLKKAYAVVEVLAGVFTKKAKQ